ncbi:sugar transferase [Neotabrizicola shimadae]|nr:sugar transferase [Neotabrizicola shimadae]
MTLPARAPHRAISVAQPAPPSRSVSARPIPAWKRPLDLALTLPGLLALAPVFLLIALAVRLSSPGPVFFVQRRIGIGGRPFGMIKFRSMYRDAAERRAALLAQSDRAGICFKSRNDPRVTPVGRILRRLSLDELPQLLNVVAGQMSLVGPRPALPEEVAAYPERALGRLAVLPGITGPWQVSGRAEIGFDEMVELDLDYARNPRLTVDLRCLLQTFSAVISGRGAY